MKATKRAALLTVSAVLVLSPYLSSGQERGGNEPTGFCIRASEVRSSVNFKLSELENNRIDKRADVLNSLNERRTLRDTQTQERRNTASATFDEAMRDIDELADSDAKRQAVADFRASVKRAQDVRKAAVDGAVKQYRTDFQTLVTRRQEAIRTSALSLRTAALTAANKANTDCQAGVDSAQVRDNFTAEMKVAGEKYRSDVKAVESIASQIRDLITVRNAAISDSNKVFKAAVLAAKNVLKAALDQTGE